MSGPVPRTVLPIGAWPDADREAWDQGVNGTSHAGGIRALRRRQQGQPTTRVGQRRRARRDGHPKAWTPQRRDDIARAYGRWLRHLAATDPDSLELDPGARATGERLQGYLEELERDRAPASQHTYLQRLLAALRVVAPGGDWSSLAQLVRDVAPRLHDAVHRLDDVRHPAVLLALAEQLIGDAEAARTRCSPISSGAAVLFRDGVMLATLVLTVLRRRSLLALALGDTLIETPDGFVIVLREEHTKARRPERVPVHPQLAAWLKRYLADYRPVLARGGTHSALWLSQRGNPLGDMGCWSAISNRTKVALGVAIGPHFVRHCVASSTVIDHPERFHELAAVLQHRDFRVTERHYVLVSQLQAARRYHQTVEFERRRSADLEAEPNNDRREIERVESPRCGVSDRARTGPRQSPVSR